MAYVASALLFGGKFTDAASHTVYTTPLQKRTIVKSVLVRNLASAAAHIAVNFKGAGINDVGSMLIYLAATGSDGDSKSVDLWNVMVSGTTIQIAWSNASGGFVAISGAELEL